MVPPTIKTRQNRVKTMYQKSSQNDQKSSKMLETHLSHFVIYFIYFLRSKINETLTFLVCFKINEMLLYLVRLSIYLSPSHGSLFPFSLSLYFPKFPCQGPVFYLKQNGGSKSFLISFMSFDFYLMSFFSYHF